jgi:enoyl-CoA hydratase/carnithine racemase
MPHLVGGMVSSELEVRVAAERTYSQIQVGEVDDAGVARIVLNRPERLNAISALMREELIDSLRKLDSDPAARAIVLTGAGDRAFGAGQDLSEARSFGEDVIDAWIDEWTALYRTVIDLATPTVAAVNGYAVGAAFQLAAVCDIRIASETARFGMPEVDDAIPCITGSWSLLQLIGRAQIADLILTGRMIDANEALNWGLVSRVVPAGELEREATALGATLAAKSATALALNKAFLGRLALERLDEFETYAKDAHRAAFRSGEPQEAMARFLTKQADGRAK